MIAITNGVVVSQGAEFVGYVVVDGDKIVAMGKGEFDAKAVDAAWKESASFCAAKSSRLENIEVVDACGGYIMAGVIDDQVHFREPGMTEKADIESEAIAAIAGGVTTFMDMPNNKPAATTIELLEAKYDRASQVSVANYSFYFGATNDNIDQIVALNPKTVCGVKVFMGSSTGNMLVDRKQALEDIFSKSKVLVATHCEDEDIVSANMKAAFAEFGDEIPMELHPKIRSEEACYKSSSFAVGLAKKFGTRLHVLHLTTAREMELFASGEVGKIGQATKKRVTNEVCAHHLWFCDKDYDTLGGKIKCNPAIKTISDRDALRDALKNGVIDVVATDHAPHLFAEKEMPYTKCPSGLPLVQHSLVAMLEMFDPISVTKYMSENVADCFDVEKRGYLKVGYFADITIIAKQKWRVSKENILYKCGWSPLEGVEFKHKVTHTFVNGNLIYANGVVSRDIKGERVTFNR